MGPCVYLVWILPHYHVIVINFVLDQYDLFNLVLLYHMAIVERDIFLSSPRMVQQNWKWETTDKIAKPYQKDHGFVKLDDSVDSDTWKATNRYVGILIEFDSFSVNTLAQCQTTPWTQQSELRPMWKSLKSSQKLVVML